MKKPNLDSMLNRKNHNPGEKRRSGKFLNLSVFLYSLVSLGLAVIISFNWISVGSAQNSAGSIRMVRTLDMDQVSIRNPVGLAYSQHANVFHVLESPGPTLPQPGYTDIITINAVEERKGSARITAAITDPINTAFDNLNNRLLILQPQANKLISVKAESDGNLDPRSMTRFDARSFDLQDPQGMAVDPSNGDLYILDNGSNQLVHIETGVISDFSNFTISKIDLQDLPTGNLRGITFDPTTDNLHVYHPSGGILFEITTTAQLVATRDISSLDLNNPQGMVFAPSADSTDDPAEQHLFIADSGQDNQTGQLNTLASNSDLPTSTGSQPSSGTIAELSFAEAITPQALDYTASLIRTVDAATWNPPSPDPSGLAYLPDSNTLIIDDGEVEETVGGVTHFEGVNVWETNLRGNVQYTANVSKIAPTNVPMSNEPTGIAWNPANNHYYFTDDGAKEVFDLNPGGDGLLGTNDDDWTRFDTLIHGSGDPEGIAFDTWNDRLFVADGVNMEIYEFTLNGTLVNHFDVAAFGVADPESVEFNPSTGTLFVLSSNRSSPVLVEVTTNGDLLQTIDTSAAGARAAAGLAYAPASDGSGIMRFYIVDRGIDNNSDPNIIDGKLYELSAPGNSNLPPVANDDTAVTSRETLVNINVAANDTDPNGNLDPASTTAITQPGSGTLTNNGDGTFNYIPIAGFTGGDSFTYEICDTLNACDTANVTITVTQPNDPPVANDDFVTTDEDNPLTINVAANDTDPDGNLDPASARSDCSTCSGTSNGSLGNNDDGTFTYTPNPDFFGTDGFIYEICDILGACDTANVSITVNSVADSPVANDDNASTVSGTPVAINVVANDTDPDGDLDPNSTTAITQPGSGTLTNNGDGSFYYTPDLNFIGTDGFAYEICDALGACDTANVSITVSDQQSVSKIYFSSNSGGNVDGVSFTDEDILAFDTQNGTWAMHFDGSDVGLGSIELDGFYINPDGSILISIDPGATLPDVGSIEDSDIVRFIPASLGENTSGSYEMYFDGSDVDLTGNTGEDIDAIGFAPDGNLVISTRGSHNIGGLSGGDTNLLKFTGTSFGDNTSGTWELYFDGNDVGIGDGGNNEDVNGLWIASNGDIYLTSRIDFAVNGLTGDNSDIYVCEPSSLGETTVCNFSMFWDGSTTAFAGENINGISIETSGGPGNSFPVVNILSPHYGGTFNEGTAIAFTATATDNEDGDITSSIVWESDLSNVIGNGGSFNRSDLPVGVHTVTATVTDSSGSTSFDTARITIFAPANVLVAAGDIASCGYDEDDATAKLLETIPGTVATLGDNVYPDGTAQEFSDCYDPTWGRHVTRTRPSLGNHDYHTLGAAGYFGYFGAAAGDPAKGYYSYNIGDWHIIALNSECSEVGGCNINSAQGQWLQADLEANPKQCTLAYWHSPRFSSGFVHGGDTSMGDFWQLLYEAGADVILNGHEHNYERFALQNPAGNPDPNGIRQFVVGTGGAGLYDFNLTPAPNSEVRESNTHGVLKLTLNQTSYNWEFVPISGQAFSDSGSADCVSPSTNNPPTAGDDNATVAEGGTLNQGPPGLLSNDSDPDSDPLTVTTTPITNPSNGTVSLGVDGSYTYTHNGGETTTDSFDYEVCDDGLLCATATVSITITPVNDLPVANASGPYSGVINTSIQFDGSASYDVDGTIVSYNWVFGDGSTGSGANPSHTYASPGTFNVQLTVTDNDGASATDTTTASISAAPNNPPTAGDDTATVAEGGTLDVAAPGLLDNDSDPDSDPLSVSTTPVTGPSYGTLSLGVDGSYTYTHNGSETTTDSFVYQVCDDGLLCDTATVSITITAVNDPPVAADDSGTVVEGGTLDQAAPGVLGNDSDPENDPLTVKTSPITPPSYGTLTLNADGSYSYTHNGSQTASDSFVYEVCDLEPLCDTATVNINVQSAAPQTIETRVSASDDDAEERVSSGRVGLTSSDLELIFDREDQFVGIRFAAVNIPPGASITSAYLQFQADEINSDPTSLLIEGQKDSNPLIFDNINFNISERPRTIAMVSWNPDPWTSRGEAGPAQRTPDLKTVVDEIVSQPGWAQGNPMVFIISGSGKRVAEAFNGDQAGAALLHVEFLAGPPNNPPTAVDDNATVAEGGTLDVAAPGLLGNDSDPDSDPLDVSSSPVTGPDRGSLTLNTNGSYTYVHDGSETTADSFDYEVCDDGLLCATATVSITITPVNDPPVANAGGPYSGAVDIAVNFDGSASFDVDGTIVSYNWVFGDGSTGSGANPSHTYTSTGTFSVQLTVTDNNGESDTHTTTASIADAPNNPPTAGDDNATVAEGGTLDVAAPGLLGNDNDPDSDPLRVSTTPVTGPSYGTLSLGVDGSYTYTHNGSETTTDSFVYQVCDDGLLCDTATVSITITAVNDPPVAADDAGTVVEGGTLNQATPGVLGNDSDPENDPLSVKITPITPPSYGTLTLNADGSYSYTHNGSQTTSDSFVYEVCDLEPLCDTATVYITISASAPTTIEIRIGASLDDAEESSSGVMDLNSSDLELIREGSDQTVGMRFNGISIPQGAIISSAYIQFQVDETKNIDPILLTIQGEKVDDALTFDSSAYNISTRNRTDASIDWSPPQWLSVGEQGVNQQTPDIAMVIQEIVNQPGWLNGNSLVIIITGTGKRVAEAYDGNQSGAPLLHIEYTPGS